MKKPANGNSPSNPVRLAAMFALVCLTAGGIPALAQEPSQQETIRIETNLVSIPVIVSDQQGRYVPDLQKQDFTIYQDRIRQQTAFFATSEEPLSVALLLDTSRSTQDILGDIRKAGSTFLKQLRPQDKAMVVSFDYQVHVLCGLTSDRKTIENSVKNAKLGDFVGTTLRDAIRQVIETHFRAVNGRKAIVLLTDGKDHGSRTSVRDLLEAVEESDTMIYPIYYVTGPRLRQPRVEPFPRPFPRRGGWGRRFPMPPPQRFPRPPRPAPNPRINERAEEFLGQLAEFSAGRLYFSQIGDLKKTFESITDELRHQYRLGFYPENARSGESHQLRIEVSRPGLVVRARRRFKL